MNSQTLPAETSHHQQFIQQISHDFDEQAQFLMGWHQDYIQISHGGFKGAVSSLDLGDVSLHWELTNQSLHQRGGLGEDVIAIGVPLLSFEGGMFCGEPCQQYAIHIYSGSSGFEFISPKNLWIGLIVADRDTLMQYLSAEDQYFLNLQSRHARVLPISPLMYAKLVSFLTNVYSLHNKSTAPSPVVVQDCDFIHSSSLSNIGHVSGLESSIRYNGCSDEIEFKNNIIAHATDLMVEALLVHESDMSMPALHKGWQILEKTRELIYRNSDEPMNVADVCKALNMSRRTLQYHFESTIRINPVAYLRSERLNGVRRMLKTAASVTDAATYWGFWHFGHFSQEYKKMFGELPSATFKRYHQN